MQHHIAPRYGIARTKPRRNLKPVPEDISRPLAAVAAARFFRTATRPGFRRS